MKSNRERVYQAGINVILLLGAAVIILPFLLLFLSSITDENVLLVNGYSFWPEKFSMASYRYIIDSGAKILKAYGISIVVTAVGVFLNILLSAMMAYPLTVKDLPGRKLMMLFVFFTMLFHGGLVPSYLVWTGMLHVKDTIFAQIFPNLLVSAWSVIMMRTYFSTSIPGEIYEAAQIDGAGQWTVFTKMILPLGKPILVTMGTFSGLAYWNDWTNGLYYIQKNKDLYNVQNLLNEMISNIQYLAEHPGTYSASAAMAIPRTGVQMAIAFVAILPIMLIFPFFYRYYSKGIALGAVKG